MSDLHLLAREAGLQIDWTDAAGEPQRVSDAALTGVLAALGLPADDARALGESRARLREEASDIGFLSGRVGEPVALPRALAAEGPAMLVMESGERRDIVGRTLPPIDQPGYHRLETAAREIRLAIAPPRCFAIADAAGDRRIWAPAVQIPSLRDARGAAFGDFGALADAARAFAEAGADAIAISPVHALFPADPDRYSPYAPSSRLFLNSLFADPALAGLSVPAAPASELIDWQHAIPERMALLRRTFDGRSDAIRDAVADFVEAGGDELVRHARFDALHAHFFTLGVPGGWRDWPAEYHQPMSAAVQSFAAAHPAEIDFHCFCQWLADRSLARAQTSAIDAGMALGLVSDLAVGMDPGGSHAWSRPDELLGGLSIGAPPDLLGPDGQNWGITGFSPRALRRTGFDAFIATIRVALAHAGGIRIDHALGLSRLWVVPEGRPAAEGAYLTMPMDDMLAILAIESHRARAIVIGEDLGTVPEGVRPAMDRVGMLGMRVLPFERMRDGRYVPPAKWSVDAAAMTGTHDLATVAGWWRGRDIDWTWKLGRRSRAESEAAERAARDDERAMLWRALEDAGAVEGDAPLPQETASVVEGALAFVAATPSSIALFPAEDLLDLVEQPNLPGTVAEHPNWRRRLPAPTDALLADPATTARIDRINTERHA